MRKRPVVTPSLRPSRPHVLLRRERLQQRPQCRRPEELRALDGRAAGGVQEGGDGGTSAATQSWSKTRTRRRSEDEVKKVFPSAASPCLSSAGVALRGPADAHQEAETSERGRAGAAAAETGGGGGQESQTPGGGQEEAAGAET